ncbi:MAG: HAD family hydrolase [Candidatus Binatia bacterium]
MSRDLLVFDFDGTLADSWRDIATALNLTLRENRLPEADGAQVRAWIGRGAEALVRRASGVAEPARLEALVRRYAEHYARCCLDTTALYPGMGAALDALGAHALAVLSNKPTGFLQRQLEGLAAARYFAAVVGGDALPVRKPDPATLAHVVAAVGAEMPRVWMIGDSAIDVATGRAFGARTVGCSWGLRTAVELREAGADIIIDHPSELPRIVAAAVAAG